jgi:hypothetical protein
MVATSTTHYEASCREERVARMASRASHLEIEREARGWIVRNPKIPGRC